MLDNLPGLFDRNFVVGFLLPAVVLVLATVLIFSLVAQPSMPGLAITDGQLNVTDADAAGFGLGLLGTACLLGAVLLMVVNRPLYRLLEGYLYPVRWLHRLGVRGYRALVEKVDSAANACRLERQTSGRPSDGARRRYRELLLKRVRRYPDREEFVLPTTFGNTIRAAETYSTVMYGADLIPMWPRLAAVVDPEFREQMNAARAQVDCSVNLLFVVFILLVEFIAVGSSAHWFQNHWVEGAATFALLIALAAGFYNLAVVTASTWGSYLRSASDLYLPSLQVKLGYSSAHSTEEQFQRWVDLSRSFLYLEKLPLRLASIDATGDGGIRKQTQEPR